MWCRAALSLCLAFSLRSCATHGSPQLRVAGSRSRGGWQPHRIVSRLLMRTSNFLEQEDGMNFLVNEIANKFYHTDGMNPYCGARYAREVGSEDEDSDADDAQANADDILKAMRIGLHENSNCKEWLRQLTCPVELLQSAKDGVNKALNQGSKRGALKELPLYHDINDDKKAGSAKEFALNDWLKSDQAADWRLERKQLWAGKANDAIDTRMLVGLDSDDESQAASEAAGAPSVDAGGAKA